MRRSLLALSLGGFLARAQRQAPLSTEQQVKVDLRENLTFDWNGSPDPDETGHLIFNSVSGLLNHWHNAYYRNGLSTSHSFPQLSLRLILFPINLFL